ncbi:hypothetical protein FACS1894104_0240 [Actinomycetota bacterium]|nr:hypothetical protein FACS1894104_0240 [Actinomycetota bacterium]
MASKLERYITSDKFRKDMSKMGPDARPFNNATPSSVVYQKIADAYKTSERQSKSDAV